MKPIIEIQHLNVTYMPGRSNQVLALRDINLTINAGEYVIFFGPSGCGKSTLLYSIAGLERNIGGTIIVDEKNVRTLGQRSMEEFHQRTIGMIFQSYYLINSLTAAQNVALPGIAVRMSPKLRMERALMLLEQFGVKEQAFKLPTELSGGQQQRVAICRALMSDPAILVADEPVGNLDSKSSEEVMDVLRYLNDEHHKTIILVTHDPTHLHHANRIFYMRDGTVTGMKENTEQDRKFSVVAAAEAGLSNSIDHWARTLPLSEESKSLGQYLQKSQQVMATVLTGMTVEEITGIEEQVFQFLHSDKPLYVDDMYQYLILPRAKGGIGLNHQKAKRLAEEITRLVNQIQHITHVSAASDVSSEEDDTLSLTALEAKETRRSLLDSFDIHLQNLEAVHNMDETIRKRIEGFINMDKVEHLFDLPVGENGAGLDKRVARKLARHLETLVFTPGSSQTSAMQEMAEETPSTDKRKAAESGNKIAGSPEKSLPIEKPKKPRASRKKKTSGIVASIEGDTMKLSSSLKEHSPAAPAPPAVPKEKPPDEGAPVTLAIEGATPLKIASEEEGLAILGTKQSSLALERDRSPDAPSKSDAPSQPGAQQTDSAAQPADDPWAADQSSPPTP